MKIVIVDDSPANVIILRYVAAALGITAIETFGQSALACAHLQNHRADLIIVDCVMPVIDGVELTRIARNLPHLRETPILMVTQLTDRETRRRAIKAGVNEFVSKPINSEELKAKMLHILYSSMDEEDERMEKRLGMT